jgi:hypothetical protein
MSTGCAGAFYHPTSMRAHLTSITAVVATLAIMPAVAHGATLTVDRPCYADASQRQDLVSYSGSGFVANAPFTVSLDGKPLAGGTGTVDGSGNIAGSFVAPALKTVSRTTHEHSYTLGVSDGTSSATVGFSVAKLYADFQPSQGNPKTLKVAFRLFGFGLQGTPSPAIYLHYVRPDGKVQKTESLGHGRGACGSRKKTALRRLFDFKPVHGSWTLQFDTAKKFKRGTKAGRFLFYTVPVTVRASSKK